VVIIEGLPAGLPITEDEIQAELGRRRLGYGRGPRMRFEQDELTIHAGIRHGRTLGSPVAIEVGNTEWPKWVEEMSAAPGMPSKILTEPRPGHADLAGMQKFGFADARDVLERASARETAARVVVGTFAKKILSSIGVTVLSHVMRIGEAAIPDGVRPGPYDTDVVDASEVRCFDPATAEEMVKEIKAAMKVGDSLGGSPRYSRSMFQSGSEAMCTGIESSMVFSRRH
jgi:chorismate synthase